MALETLLTSITNVGMLHYIILSALVFTIGMCGVFIHRQSIIGILLSIELMLLGVNICFVAASVHWQSITGQIFVIFILAVAAAEVALGLAILVLYFAQHREIGVGSVSEMRG